MPGSCDLLEGCSIYCCEPTRFLIESHVNSPFVEITVGGSAGTITVGNQSQPHRGNHAVVKSLKYGHSVGGGGGGLALEVEVTDEAGGAFTSFISSLVTKLDFKEVKKCNWIMAKWGWINSNCDGVDVVDRFTVHTLDLQSIEFAYTNGLMKFNLKGLDNSQIAFQTATDRTYGTTENPMPLKKAIIAICDEYATNVRFLRPRSLQDWNFGPPGVKDGKGDPDWPRGSWKSQGENYIQAIMRWVAHYKTDRQLGITPAFNSRLPPGQQHELILWESFASQCGQIKGCDSSIGTYIVNGGKNSPVLSFQPNLNWKFGALNKSSGASSNVANQQLAETGNPNCQMGPDEPEQGMRTYNIVSDDAINVYGTQTALPSIQEAQAEHARANASYNNINGELKIQGDPLLAAPIDMVGKTCSIVVINPFHIQAGIGGNECGDWLQAETCNSVLSNRQWMIRGTSHEVKEGSYTTTIKVFLESPGSEISLGEPLGQDESGFVIPQGACPGVPTNPGGPGGGGGGGT